METTAAKQENKMGTMPVGRLLFQMSLPMIISMVIQALYNIVDSMYVSQINENALTAVSLVFPMQNLMIAIATGTGVGINALLSGVWEKRIIKTPIPWLSTASFWPCSAAWSLPLFPL